ncbi:cellobiose dehydrogenase [Microdochium trichocladiopsis]|uniref:Cellobiose dehydrogenase n=1 Tax=Microdochium trichocladiopsis TaxID=1682393 RepID=A0A9P8Y7P2_9PEZI|nr:cellobiose dehydrogenase [Microdochium trichocladiopsis]KAH7031437.1 cellobiose dehydrogenase [Microdochium trichocladiopsis]
MGRFGILASLLLAVGLNVQQTAAQGAAPATYKDPTTGIIFNTWSVPDRNVGGFGGAYGGMKIGMALPANALTVNANEFIGILECPKNSTVLTGYCGISLGGGMPTNLLLTAWPSGNDVLTSFRWATGYVEPELYTGNAKLTQISSAINATHFRLIYRCENCLSWNQDGTTGGASTSNGGLTLGWAAAFQPPTGASCASSARFVQHDNGQSIWGAGLDSNAANPSYTSWAALATKTVTGNCGSTPTSSSTSVPAPTGTPVPNKQYDYIVVGAGAGGIPIADKLSEAGKKVLLIEKGPASLGRWAGNAKPNWNTPPWLEGTGLTRFDVPGLCNEIWVDSAGIACSDVDRMAGCVLGGGTAVNAGLWFKPNAIDWDYNFPSGWKSSDMTGATNRVFSRIPGTDTPSVDGKRYLQQGFDALATGLKAGGWTEVTANNAPSSKNRTFAHAPFMFSGGQRGGPLTTYLDTASKRSNFDLWLNTAVKRVVRTGGHATGLEVEPFRNGGYVGTINLTPVTGRVILSAGAFGTSKILFRSGIGPSDVLGVVKNSTDGPTMISTDQWIPLPVGKNLEDHTNTDMVISHPNVVFYDFYEAFDEPIAADKTAYLSKRSGILAQAAPNIGPMAWESIKNTPDGVERQLQWTARVEGSLGAENGKTMTLSQYLGRGAKSRGRLTLTPSLSVTVSTLPYLTDKGDVAAVIQGIKNMQAALNKVPNLTFVSPAPGQSAEDYVAQYVVSSNRGSNHWIGSAKLGVDDGRSSTGTSVVDVNAQVYGTDNIFVVDASIFPGHVTTNPSAYIVVASERAAERILALAPAAARNQFDQCGGLNYSGSFQCKTGYTCKKQNDYYWQCLA